MAEEQSIFSKLLNKDKEIESLHSQIRNLNEEKQSLEYMLLKSSEQLRKLQDLSESQDTNRNENQKELQKLNQEIDSLQKDVQLAKMNCSSQEQTNNLLNIEIQNMSQYITKLSRTVHNSYQIIQHYSNVEKQKLDVETQLKKYKKKHKSLKSDFQDLNKKLLDLDGQAENSNIEMKKLKELPSIQDLISKIEQQNNDYKLSLKNNKEKENQIIQIKQQFENQKSNISALNKQISFLKIENLSLKNRIEKQNNIDFRQNAFQSNQGSQQMTGIHSVIPKNKQRTKSLDNTINYQGRQQQLFQMNKQEGCDQQQQIKQQNFKTMRFNSYSPFFENNHQQHTLNFSRIHDSLNSLKNQDFNNISSNKNAQQQNISNKQCFNSFIEGSYQNKNEISQIDNDLQNKSMSFTSQNFQSLNNHLNCLKNNQQQCNNNNYRSQTINDTTYLLCQHCLTDNNKYEIDQVNNNNTNQNSSQINDCTTISNIQGQTENNNDLVNIKQILLMIEDIILKEKIEKGEILYDKASEIFNSEFTQECMMIVKFFDAIIQKVHFINSWQSRNVVLLCQKIQSLVQIAFVNLCKQIKIRNNDLDNTNKDSFIIHNQHENTFLDDKDNLFNSKSISENKNMKINSTLDEQNQLKQTNLTMLKNKNIIENSLLNKKNKEDDIKNLLTELQELNQSADYNQQLKTQTIKNQSNNIQQMSKQQEQKVIIEKNEIKIMQNNQETQTESINTQVQEIKQEQKVKQESDNNYQSENNLNIDKFKKQVQQQFTKKVKDLEQILLIIKNILNDEKENNNNSNNNQQYSKESLNKLYSNNPNLQQFLNNFIEKINHLKSTNQQLNFELKKYQLSNKHVKNIR